MRARNAITGLTAAALIGTVALVGSGGLSTANATGPVASPAGTLTLTTANGTVGVDQWSFNDGVNALVQSLAATSPTTSCYLASSGAALVNSSALNGTTAATPGIYNHLLGVTTAATPNAACGQINLNKVKVGKTTTDSPESLTLALNNGPTGALGNALTTGDQATSGTLDVAAFDDTTATISTYLGTSTTPVSTVTLIADEFKPKTLPAGGQFCLTPLGLTGKPGYCTVPLTGGNFDRVVVTAKAGWAAVGGGSQWPQPTSFTLVKFYDGTLGCGANTGDPVTSTNASITVNRLDNGDTSSTCALIPYTLTAGDGTATFQKPSEGSQASAQFEVTFTRTIQPDATLGAVTLPIAPVTINWQDSAVTTGGTETVDTLTGCPLPLYDPAHPTTFNYNLIPTTQPPLTPDPVTGATALGDQSPLSGIQYACQISESQALQPGGALLVTDLIYVTGDMILGSGHH